ncbi:hypothetical protein BA895_09405 [Humibacillus sp. DSM 29435]|uniref:ArnT family glycosyltransferase n=1 Tax=Humibacillus sp. DSM 29435 TaxID=1869167 RepID=UPI00087271A0|nr:glycosyltransferase family 39 protein [Humibacillus sp. DSM 29435]OFE14566.1 hypothetical protein BA895_09405 [Humibacillus sp. DSM 29435]
MTKPEPKRTTARSIVPFVVVFTLTVLLPRLMIFPVVGLGADEAAYGIIGREVLAGHWPYTTAFDHKPAALYYPYALSQAVFGASTASLRCLSLVVAVLSFVLAYLICRRLGLGGWGAALLSGVYALMCVGSDGLAALSEPTLNLYVLGLLLVLTYRPTFWRGAVFGLLMAVAINTNYLIGPVLVIPGLYFLVAGRKAKMAWAGGFIAFLVGCLVILLPVFLFSNITNYFELQRTFLSVYDKAPVWWPKTLRRVEGFLAPTLAVLLVPITALVLGAPRSRQVKVTAWSVVFLVVSIATACYNQFFYAHYAIIIAPAALVIAVIAVRRYDGAARSITLPSVVLAVAVWAMVVPELPRLLKGAEVARAQLSLGPDRSAPEIEVAQAVRRVVEPGDVIYTMDVHDYFLTGAGLPTKFFFPSQHLKESNAAAMNSTPAAEVRAILAQRPRAIVMRVSPAWPESVSGLVDEYVRDRCRLSAQVQDQEISVYACPSP